MGIADKTKNTMDFRELAETAPVALFQVDPQGHCTYANAACVRLLDVVDPLGTGWMQAVHPLDQAIATAMWHRPYHTLGIERVLRLGRQDGPVTHVRIRATPLMEPGGGLRGYAVTAVDVTPSASKLERLESANAFLARAEEVAGVGCWRFDIRTRELLWTSNMRRIHELPDDYVPRGDEHVKYFPAEARAQLEAAVTESLASRKPWDIRVPMRTATGREIWVRSFGEPEEVDGRVVAVVGVLHDVTLDRRRLEELRAARDAAATLNRAKTELLGMISHRVRTPLNGIVGNTQLMLMEAALPPELRRQMDQVAQSARALLTVVEEVLGTDGIETGRLQKRAAAAPPPAPVPTGQRKPRILVVEDHPVNQAVATGLLRKLGCEHVDVANDGSEAVQMAADGRYELILMDCQMPVMDGYEATRRLREAGCRSQIVAVTASVSRGARERCLAAGMDEYVSKPIDIAKLQEILAQCEAAASAAPAPAFSTAPLAERFGGDEELVAVAIESFRSNTPQTLRKLGAAVAATDRGQVGLLAHSIKGAGLMICADEVAAVAAELERSASAGAPQELSGGFERLSRAFDTLLPQLSPAPDSLPPSPASPAALTPALEALRMRCIEACDRCTSVCDLSLGIDDRYTSPGTDPYSAVHLSLVSCSSVCSIVSSSLEGDLGNAVEMTQWCAEVCRACRDLVSAPEQEQPAGPQIAAACDACAQACAELAEALVPRPVH